MTLNVYGFLDLLSRGLLHKAGLGFLRANALQGVEGAGETLLVDSQDFLVSFCQPVPFVLLDDHLEILDISDEVLLCALLLLN